MTRSALHARLVVAAVAACATIFAISCDGSMPAALPPPPVEETFTSAYPVFSRDGREIYFIGQRSKKHGVGIFAVDTAGGLVREIVFDDMLKMDLRLSPDGRTVSFVAAPYPFLECCGTLWTADTAGGAPLQVTTLAVRVDAHRWSPDGRWVIAHELVEGESGAVLPQIFRIAPDGSGFTLLTRGGGGHAFGRWSADGSRIFYLTYDSITSEGPWATVMEADGSHARGLDSARAPAGAPLPSPTRSEIALPWRMGRAPEAGGYVVGNDSLVYPAGDAAFRRIVPELPPNAEWSADGERIAFTLDDPAHQRVRDLWVVHRDGWRTVRATSGRYVMFFGWSPDSRHAVLVAAADTPTGSELFLVDTRTGSIRQLTIHA